MMEFNELFDILDLDRDEKLSREELHRAAKQLGRHWHEASFFAVFDLLTVLDPISRKTFNSFMNQISKDPYGPYGSVLLNVKYDSLLTKCVAENFFSQKSKKENILQKKTENQIIQILEQSAGRGIADDYQKLLGTLDFARIHPEDTALLIIDPQRSFTKGAWMKSIGSQAQQDIRLIESGFRHCAQFIRQYGNVIETMFSRCPFPPDSYDWDDHFKGIIDPMQLYFIKPGNSILFPPTNGYRQWVERVMDKGKNILVMGGCTLNSCVRVSAIETLAFFKSKNLRVVADLSICGARLENYRRSDMFGGLSSVESAVREMAASGVEVVRGVDYDL
jgi:nicotinamidase-related amidase